jgi:hypothetical protein
MKIRQNSAEYTASEVLNFAEGLKQIRRENALAILMKYSGRFKAGKFNHEKCYDRQIAINKE